MKKAISIILILVLMAAALLPGAAAGAPQKINYVAFGDSVSAGVRGGIHGFELESDKGFTDNIAERLERLGILGSFNEDFCISGETAKGMAQRTAVLKNPDSSAAALVRKANLITLDIGANDLLWPLFADIMSLDSFINFDIDDVKQKLNDNIDDLYHSSGVEIQKNINIILQNMLTANTGAAIYVMGYYNPLPTLSSMLDVDLNAPSEYLNTLIKKAISDVQLKYPQASIFYVSTFDVMAASASNLVATDIHPTEAGYEVIADAFWKQIKMLNIVRWVDASVSASRFSVNSKPVPLRAYIINDYNYIMLRDLAAVLDGTAKTFSVIWDGAGNAVTITAGERYTPQGGELAPPVNSGKIEAALSDSFLILNGKSLDLTAYIINGHNYIRLRDLASALNFNLIWDEKSNTVNFNLAKTYTLPQSDN